MNLEEKRRLANERRLNAVKQWKKNRNVQQVARTHVKYDDQDVPHVGKNVKLFDSDSEEESYEDCFDSRPQFEGKNGSNLLQMSSGFSNRFKLDERFQEDHVEIIDKNEEISKNIKILESVLGHQVGEKTTAESLTLRKKQWRFDPENSYADTDCLKIPEKRKKKNKQCKEKEKSSDITQETIPKSSERYIEVSSNLKDILSSSSGGFSLTDRFTLPKKSTEFKNIDFSTVEFSKKPNNHHVVSKRQRKMQPAEHSKFSYFEGRTQSDPFFLIDDDFRLKEGVEFFYRPKPLEIIQEDWIKNRNAVLDLFKKKRFSLRVLAKKSRSFRSETLKKN